MKIKYVMIGRCDRCGKEFVRPPEVTVAACDCESANLIELEPVLVLPKRVYGKIERIAKEAHVSLETLVNAVLEKALEAYSPRLRNNVTS